MAERCQHTQDIFGALMTADQIKRILKEKGWTQREAAEYLGLTKDWFCRVVNNRKGERRQLHDCAILGLPRK